MDRHTATAKRGIRSPTSLTCDVCNVELHGNPGVHRDGEYFWPLSSTYSPLQLALPRPRLRMPIVIASRKDPAADQRPRKQNNAKKSRDCIIIIIIISTQPDMATQQDEGGVPFSMAHEMQQFRLFELPPEIVELLDAPNPPL